MPDTRTTDQGGAIALADFGSFFVPGRTIVRRGLPAAVVRVSDDVPDLRYDLNGTYEIEQAYVQYFVPAVRRVAEPVVLVHGGALTGAMWETTPDGRPSWLTRLPPRVYACYVIDTVERGRAGWCTFAEEWPGEPLPRAGEQAWWFFRIGRPEDFGRRVAAPGQRFPVAAYDGLVRQLVPRWMANSAPKVTALARLAERLGRCHLIGFSEGGETVQNVLAARPGLVASATILETITFPPELAAAAGPGMRALYVYGDGFELSPRFATAFERAAATVAELAAVGADATLMSLPAVGLAGNTHMMMMDETGDDVLSLVCDWIERG